MHKTISTTQANNRLLILLLLSVALFSFGQGIITTIVSLKVSDQNIGTITSIYYLGMLSGAINSTFLIKKLGAIRAFMIFILGAMVASMALGFYTSTPIWYIARFLIGYASALLYIVVENAILTISRDHNRMKFLVWYGISLYGTGALSQAYLRIFTLESVAPFYIGGALTFSAALPALAVRIPNTQAAIEVNLLKLVSLYKILPASIICSFMSGVLSASIYNLLPRHIEDIGMDVKSVSDLMAWTIGGAVLLRYPIGYLSDLIGKERTLILSCVTLLALSVAWLGLSVSGRNTMALMSIMLFFFGGLIFTMYSVCMAYLSESIKNNNYNTHIPQGMLLSYSLGCIGGPLAISWVVNFFPKHGLFISFALVTSYMIVVLLTNEKKRHQQF